MHRFLFSGAAALAVLSIPPAQAETNIRPYIGFDVQQYRADYRDDGDEFLEDSLNGGSIHAGARIGTHFGAELGYFRTKEEGKNSTVLGTDIATDVKVQGVTLDALGYLPVGPAQRFELIGTAGISYSKADVSVDVPGIVSGSGDDSELGFRAGAGAQYALSERFNVRGLARYQSADFDDAVDHSWIYSAGLNYSF